MHAWPLLRRRRDRRAARARWIAFKVGALSYGGGFVIIPLMQDDAVDAYHWMTDAQFLNAVALGQVTPGPVVHTVAVVGYAAAGRRRRRCSPPSSRSRRRSRSSSLGADRFDRLRANPASARFLDGAGPAAIGAILGAAIPLAARARPSLAVRGPRRRGASRSSCCAAASSLTLLAAGAIGALQS